MAKQHDTLTIDHLTAVEWQCPYCQTGNGIPEVSVCACGAVRDGSTATAPGQPKTAAGPDNPATTTDSAAEHEA